MSSRNRGLALLLTGITLVGCDATGPHAPGVRVSTAERHAPRVAHEGSDELMLAVPFTIENRGIAPVYLQVGRNGEVRAGIQEWREAEGGWGRPVAFGRPVVFPDDLGYTIPIDPGSSFDGTMTAYGAVSAEEGRDSSAQYRVLVDALYDAPPHDHATTSAAAAALLPPHDRASNPFRVPLPD